MSDARIRIEDTLKRAPNDAVFYCEIWQTGEEFRIDASDLRIVLTSQSSDALKHLKNALAHGDSIGRTCIVVDREHLRSLLDLQMRVHEYKVKIEELQATLDSIDETERDDTSRDNIK